MPLPTDTQETPVQTKQSQNAIAPTIVEASSPHSISVAPSIDTSTVILRDKSKRGRGAANKMPYIVPRFDDLEEDSVTVSSNHISTLHCLFSIVFRISIVIFLLFPFPMQCIVLQFFLDIPAAMGHFMLKGRRIIQRGRIISKIIYLKFIYSIFLNVKQMLCTANFRIAEKSGNIFSAY